MKEFAIFDLTTRRLNALVNNLMDVMGITDPVEASVESTLASGRSHK